MAKRRINKQDQEYLLYVSKRYSEFYQCVTKLFLEEGEYGKHMPEAYQGLCQINDKAHIAMFFTLRLLNVSFAEDICRYFSRKYNEPALEPKKMNLWLTMPNDIAQLTNAEVYEQYVRPYLRHKKRNMED